MTNPKSDPNTVQQLRFLARLMDDILPIPGTGWRIGLDGIIGLIPGVGDVAGFAASAYIIMIAARLEVSKPVLLRMLLNTLIETLVGAIPFFGDVFDFAWKANRRNLILLERALMAPRSTSQRSLGTLLIAIVGLGAIGFIVIWLILVVGRAVMGLAEPLFR